MARKLAFVVSINLWISCQSLDRYARLEVTLSELQKTYDIAGMSVMLLKDDDVLFSGAYGLRDVHRNLPVDAHTQYRVASISKMVTATALMQLHERGLLDLDDDVSHHLGFALVNPRFPDEKITFEMLLSHTSSLRDGKGYAQFLTDSYTKRPPPDIRELLITGGVYFTTDMYDSLHSPDQSYFEYANINFGIIGTLIEEISGERFDRYCKRHILDPLGMDASFNVRDLSDIDDLAVLYRKPDSIWVAQKDDYSGIRPPPVEMDDYVLGRNGVVFAPQGGLRTSAADLSKFMRVHMNGGAVDSVRVLESGTVARMFDPVWVYDGKNGDTLNGMFKQYGLGTHLSRDFVPGEPLAGHSGLAYGLVANMYFSKEKRIGMIFILNGGSLVDGDSGWTRVEEDVMRFCYREMMRGR